MVIEVEQLQQRKGRVSNAELPVPRNERERGRVFEDERPVPGRVPFAWVKRHAIDYHGKPDDAAQRQGRWQPYSEASLDFIARHVVGALRCVNENGAAIARWPGPVLDILRSAGNELRPRCRMESTFIALRITGCLPKPMQKPLQERNYCDFSPLGRFLGDYSPLGSVPPSARKPARSAAAEERPTRLASFVRFQN